MPMRGVAFIVISDSSAPVFFHVTRSCARKRKIFSHERASERARGARCAPRSFFPTPRAKISPKYAPIRDYLRRRKSRRKKKEEKKTKRIAAALPCTLCVHMYFYQSGGGRLVRGAIADKRAAIHRAVLYRREVRARNPAQFTLA